MTELDSIIQALGIIGAVIGFCEWRFRSHHTCLERIETALMKHIDETKPILERFFKLEERVSRA